MLKLLVNSIYIYKVVISVCLSVCLSDHKSVTPEPILPQILIGEHGRPTRMVLAWFRDFNLSGSTLIAKVYFPGKIV